MGVFRGIGSVLCLFAIIFLCILSAAFFNPELSDLLRETGREIKETITEFSEKATVNAFSEGK